LRNLKFKLKKGKGSVDGFRDAKGEMHLPGDVVDLPAAYEGEKWLEKLEEKRQVVVPPAKVEPPREVVPVVPLPEKKPQKKA
jgi:hypothetical protein